MFWKIFVSLCVQIGKKPNAVCREIGLSTATATHWKNGTLPNSDALIKLSHYFGCTIDWLLGISEYAEPKPFDYAHTVQEHELLILFRSLSADTQLKEIGRLELICEQECETKSMGDSI